MGVCQIYVRFHLDISEIKCLFPAIWCNLKTLWGCLIFPLPQHLYIYAFTPTAPDEIQLASHHSDPHNDHSNHFGWHHHHHNFLGDFFFFWKRVLLEWWGGVGGSPSNETCSLKLKDGFPRKRKQKFVSIYRNKNGVLRTRDASSTNYNLINPEFGDQFNGRTQGNVPCA